MIRLGLGFLFAAFGLLCGVPLFAGEADDMQSMIDRARHRAADLERLDEKSLVRDEITFMRVWLDEAWKLRSEQKYDEVREVLDRCEAQAEMIREKLEAAKLAAEAAAKEAALKRTLDNMRKIKESIHAATLRKVALEARAK